MRTLSFLVASALVAHAAQNSVGNWRPATESELKEIVPARAPVEKERIETELASASGVTDGKGKFIYGVVLITAGYSAEGKYSHYFVTQTPIKIGDLSLKPGEYVFGWRRNEDSLSVSFYEALTGKQLGTVEATRNSRVGRIQSFQIQPPGEKAMLTIGRFGISYKLGD